MWSRFFYTTLTTAMVVISAACEPIKQAPDTNKSPLATETTKEPSHTASKAATTLTKKNKNSALELLPKGEGHDIVAASCTACHSARLVAQNRLTRSEWDATLTWMQEKQGLWPLGANRKIILDYLEKHFSPQEQDSMDGLGMRRVNPLPEDIR